MTERGVDNGDAAASVGNAQDHPSQGQLDELYRLTGGFRISQAIFVAAELGIADQLASGPRDSDALARAVGADEDALYRLLRLLAGVGLFEEVGPRRFLLTELGAGLRSDVRGSVRPWAINVLDAARWQAWGQLLYSVRTGRVGFDQAHGMGAFDYFRAHPEVAARFNNAMTNQTARSGDAIVQAYNFSGIRRLVDVGGGHGLLLATILRAYPPMRGVLFDQPAVVAGAPPVLADAGVADRCDVIGGDFFEAVTPGADAYLLRDIIHDWDDARATVILTNCYRALSKSGKVLVVERSITPDYRKALPVLLFDLQMLVLLGGKERTVGEYSALFAEAGLRLNAVIPLGDWGQYSIFEGVPNDNGETLAQVANEAGLQVSNGLT